MRIIVSGAEGFIGSYVVEALRDRGDIVDAWTRKTVDITSREVTESAVSHFGPDVIVHLAAQSFPSRSWADPAETYRVNVGGTIALLEAARKSGRQPRILLAGSSAEYAEPIDGEPISEIAAIGPNSPYGSSKSAMMQIGLIYGSRYDLPVIGFRPFALIGPRKTGDACSDFTRRIVAIERGAVPRMPVGDLTVVRDIIDVRDGVAGIELLADLGLPGEVYNISGGHGTSIEAMLSALRGMASVQIDVVQDPDLIRPLEQKVKIGSPAKINRLGWAPKHSLEATLADTLEYWRAQERQVLC